MWLHLCGGISRTSNYLIGMLLLYVAVLRCCVIALLLLCLLCCYVANPYIGDYCKIENVKTKFTNLLTDEFKKEEKAITDAKLSNQDVSLVINEGD